MKSFNLLTGPTLQSGVTKHSTKLLSGIFLFFILFLAGTVSAQTDANLIANSKLTCNSPDRCTSKDLNVVSVKIDAPTCTNCTLDQMVTYPLLMTIHNGTKSERTSFALYGTLSDGASISFGGKTYSGSVFICVGPITVKSDQTLTGETAPGNQTFAVGSITFKCGQDLKLTNNYLAWTDAAGNTTDRCKTFADATKCSDIAPKCGTASSITITGPVFPPALDKVDPTCTTSTGCITVTSSTDGLQFSLDGGAFTDYPAGGWCGLTAGTQYCVRSKRTSDGCISDPACKTIGTAPAKPQQPTVTITEPSLCGSTTATVTVTCPTGTGYQYSNNGGAWQSSPTFSGLAAGAGFSITVKNSAGCVSAATTCTNYTTVTCDQSKAIKRTTTETNTDVAPTKVIAAPNPFNDRIRFTIQPARSGSGTLELYNMLGQKVRTVFQGQVQAGQAQTIEYAVPAPQRSNLIYLFRVGNEKTSGKLIGLKQ